MPTGYLIFLFFEHCLAFLGRHFVQTLLLTETVCYFFIYLHYIKRLLSVIRNGGYSKITWRLSPVFHQAKVSLTRMNKYLNSEDLDEQAVSHDTAESEQ